MKNSPPATISDLSAEALILHYTALDNLSTPDPYDVWKTPLGFRVKDLFNQNRKLGLLPAAVLTLFDTYINNKTRWFYRQQEYPVVRALAAQSLLNAYKHTPEPKVLNYVQIHLDWLIGHPCKGLQGMGWGLNFDYAVDGRFTYTANTPFTTMTPYVLEALVQYQTIINDNRYLPAIHAIGDFFDLDTQVMDSGNNWEAISYTNNRDRIVINASSYALYAYALLLKITPEKRAEERISRAHRLYRFVMQHQQENGSWLYSPEGNSFIDCFHSCIVVKNLVKAGKILDLPDVDAVSKRGWDYIKSSMYDTDKGLFQRFAVSNKPGLVKYDLYDNAETLILARLFNDTVFAEKLSAATKKSFVKDNGIFSQIDYFGLPHNCNTLRWAVVPYLYALSLAL
jgi:hypothetical protein